MFDISNRFDLLIFESAEDYVDRKRKEREKIDERIELYLESERNDRCEGDCTGERCRLVFGDMYLCYDCFYHSLDCEGSVSVPSMSADRMSGYMDEYEWDEHWEEEHGFI